MFWRLRAKRSPLWMTSPMTSAITQSIVLAIVLLFAIVLEVCLECIAQDHVTGATPLSVRCTNSGAYWFVVRLRKSARIALKFCTCMFSTTPDTMVMFILQENDVITLPRPFTHLLREKSRCSDCAENLHQYSFDIGRRRGGVSFSKL